MTELNSLKRNLESCDEKKEKKNEHKEDASTWVESDEHFRMVHSVSRYSFLTSSSNAKKIKESYYS